MKTIAVLFVIFLIASGMSSSTYAQGFWPWQAIWQCNDIRVTITSRSSEEVEYDLGGSVWGGSRFTVVRGNLFFNGRPCASLRPAPCGIRECE